MQKLRKFHFSIRQEEKQEGKDLWEETISCLLSSGDVGIGLVWDNHLIPYNISVWILKFCSNYLWWVLSCSQNDVRCFQLFHRCFQMFLDVFGVRRMLSRCVQMITNVGRWIFSRSSLGVLLMFSGCSQDFSRMFSGFFQDVLKGLVSVVGLGGLVPKPLVVWRSFQIEVWT